MHKLTKSTLVERDIIKQINKENRSVVGFSFSSANDEINSEVKPGVLSPIE